MLNSNVDLHFAGVEMHLAEVFILLKKHRTMGIYIVTALYGTGTLGLDITVHTAHRSILAPF